MAKFKPTRFMAEDSKYNKKAADYAVSFIECLSHTKGTWLERNLNCWTGRNKLSVTCLES